MEGGTQALGFVGKRLSSAVDDIFPEVHLGLDNLPSFGSKFSRMMNFRDANGISPGRNIGFMDVDLGGQQETSFGISSGDFPGTVPTPKNPQFTTIDTGIGNPAKDSEFKLLNFAADNYGDNPSVSGIDLYTERPPCDSCSGVINQFRSMFSIPLRVFWGPFDSLW